MKNVFWIVLSCMLAAGLVVGAGTVASADGSGSGSGSGSAATAPAAAQPVPTSPAVETAPAPTVPDPAEQPAESAGLLYKLYKAGHLIPALVVLAFFALTLAQRWIAWLRTGYRKLAVASVLAGLAMLAERAAEGTTPNLTMLMGALGVAFAMWMRTEGEPKQPVVAKEPSA